MIQEVIFQGSLYKLIITEHAILRMNERKISKNLIKEIVETGKAIKKEKKSRWWIYKKIKMRTDNDVCLSVSLEPPNLIVITTLINWRPKE
jgi:hypothetical protein